MKSISGQDVFNSFTTSIPFRPPRVISIKTTFGRKMGNFTNASSPFTQEHSKVYPFADSMICSNALRMSWLSSTIPTEIFIMQNWP